MTQHDKLLIMDKLIDISWDEHFADIADYLLNNGVIVPSCKVGDTVYVADSSSGIIVEHVNNIYTTMNCDN